MIWEFIFDFFILLQQFDILEPVFSLDPDEYEYADYTVEVEYEDEQQSDAGIDIPKNIESIADDENEVKITNNNDIIPISSLPTIDENRLNNVPEIIQSSNDESILEVDLVMDRLITQIQLLGSGNISWVMAIITNVASHFSIKVGHFS